MAVRKLNNNLNVIGDNLRNYRKEKHLSQADLTMELNLLLLFIIFIFILLIFINFYKF